MSSQPRPNDAVFGGQAPPPVDTAVLGGLSGVEQRLAKADEALFEAFEYGEAGLSLIIQALENESREVRDIAYFLLTQSPSEIAKQALWNYLPYKQMKCLYTLNLNNEQAYDINDYDYSQRDEIDNLTISADGVNLIAQYYCILGRYPVEVWNLYTGQLIRTFSLGTGFDGGENVAISPDGRTIFYSYQYFLNVLSVHTDEERSLSILNDPTTYLAIKSDNKTLIAAEYYHHTIRVHELPDEDTDEFSLGGTYALEGHTSRINSLIISPDEKTLLSQCGNPSQDCHRLWDLQTRKLIRTFETSRDWIADSLAVRPNGQTIASGTRNGTVQVWDLHTDEVIYSLTGRSPSAMTPDGKVVVCCSDLNEIIVWDLEFNQEICTLEGHSAPIQKIALSRDREFIASNSTVKGTGELFREHTLKIWGVPE